MSQKSSAPSSLVSILTTICAGINILTVVGSAYEAAHLPCAPQKIYSTENVRLLYHSLVHPHLLYCNLLWGSAAKTQVKCLEILQKRAVRIICNVKNNEHTEPLFKRLGILRFTDLHLCQTGIFMYRFMNNNLPHNLLRMFTRNTNVYDHNTRLRGGIHINKHTVDIVFKSFICRGPKLWRQIPDEVKSASSIKAFASRLKRHLTSF